MTARDRAEVAEAVGWLEGFAPTVWLLAVMEGAKGTPLVSPDACEQYEKRVAALRRLLLEEGE